MPSTPANSLNLSGAAGVVSFNGTATVSTSAITQYDVLVGGASQAIANVAPSATSGVPLISQGASANPAFGTAVVGGGGTGVTTMTTAYAPVCAGTTATGALQVASTGLSTSGYVLTSNGAAALPSFQAASGGSGFSRIVIQKFIYTGGGQTYTPTTNMKYCIIEVVGGGGGGGGCSNNHSTQAGGGGGAGGYAKKIFAAATIGSSQTITIGAAGAGAAAGFNSGGPGGQTNFGGALLVYATGGGGGGGSASGGYGTGGAGGVGSNGDFNTVGCIGTGGSCSDVVSFGGNGGCTYFGGNGQGYNAYVNSVQGGNAFSYGGGGGGGVCGPGASIVGGGNGFAGVCIITEYV